LTTTDTGNLFQKCPRNGCRIRQSNDKRSFIDDIDGERKKIVANFLRLPDTILLPDRDLNIEVSECSK